MTKEPKAATGKMTRAGQLYRSGKCGEAIRLYQEVLALRGLPRKTRLKASFWLACSLHTNGEIDRALDVIAAAHFKSHRMKAHLPIGYRIITRRALLEIDNACALATIEGTLEEARRIDSKLGRTIQSRALLGRGTLLATRGQQFQARRVLLRSLKLRETESERFATSAYMRVLLPCLLSLGRHEEVAAHLDAWEADRDPEPFKWPILEAMRAEWHRARGDVEEALEWALLARARAERVEDGRGALYVGRALCQVAIHAGDHALSRSAQRDLRSLRHRAGPAGRFSIELASIDAHLSRAQSGFGPYIIDPEYSFRYEPTSGGVPRNVAASELVAARRSWQRAQALATILDDAYECKSHRRAVRRRHKLLLELTATAKRPPLPSSPAPASPTVTPPTVSAEPTLVSRAGERWLITPTAEPATLIRLVEKEQRTLVTARRCEHPDGIRLNAWQGRRLVGRGIVWIGPRTKTSRALAFRLEDSSDPTWLDGMLKIVQRHFGALCLTEGRRTLKAGAPTKAEEILTTATRHIPDRRSAWEQLATCQIALGRLDDSLESCTRSLEIDSGKPAAWQLLHEIFMERGEYEEAKASLRQFKARSSKTI
jgi:tetratricopeptide (TPR) repeat protein